MSIAAPGIDFVVAIPARYAATRLPGKPLRLLAGDPLIVHVARRALSAGAREVWVAADDTRIADALRDSGVRVAMTSPRHVSGSDRLAECADIAGWNDDTIVVTPELTASDVDEWDSLRHIRLVAAVERRFGLSFSAAEIGRLKNVGQLVSLIGEKTKA